MKIKTNVRKIVPIRDNNCDRGSSPRFAKQIWGGTSRIIILIILGIIALTGFFMYANYITKNFRLCDKFLGMRICSYEYVHTNDTNNLNEKKCSLENTAMVEYVIDGDTIIVEGGARIRLLGIDAREKGEGCYQEAKERLEELVLGKLVRLEKGQSDVDKYGRCLRFIFYEAQNISLELAREGFAKAAFYGQDFSYRQEILEAQKQAIENRAGCIYN